MLRTTIRQKIIASGLRGKDIEGATRISQTTLRAYLQGQKSLSSNKIDKLMKLLGLRLVPKSPQDLIQEARRNV